jgi:hypothetical protein
LAWREQRRNVYPTGYAAQALQKSRVTRVFTSFASAKGSIISLFAYIRIYQTLWQAEAAAEETLCKVTTELRAA